MRGLQESGVSGRSLGARFLRGLLIGGAWQGLMWLAVWFVARHSSLWAR